MSLYDLVSRTRTYRRFDESHKIDYDTLVGFIDMARLSPSGANKQPLKYLLYNEKEDCDRIFPSLAWAGYLTDWPGPEQGERPSAYIIILGDRIISDTFGIDHGIAAQTIMLGAAEAGLGGCIIASVKHDDLQEELKIPDDFEILLVLALGKPVETVVVDEVKNDDIRYWRDKENVHHVPKRGIDDLILRL